jgi:glutamine amidotransferase
VIGILDYGVGNVGAFLRIYHSNNIKAMAVSSPNDFDLTDKIILPGVGAFDSSMKKINSSGLRDPLDNFVLHHKKPILGVCIGMHMLGNFSEEGNLEGLNYINGHTKKITFSNEERPSILPHMGWNDIIVHKKDSIWTNINLEQGFYFLHSYHFVQEESELVLASSDYNNTKLTCAVKQNDIYGFQFHPEKSLSNGSNLLKNFAHII